MEKDIKILEEMKFWEGCEVTIDEKWCKAFENLLKRYKELEEEHSETNIKILSNAGIYQLGFNDGRKSSIPISVIQNILDELDKKEKEELKGLKGQDRYFVKQMYQYMRKPLQEILEKGNK